MALALRPTVSCQKGGAGRKGARRYLRGSMEKMTIKAQFGIGAAAILTLFCMGAAMVEYHFMKMQVVESVHKKTEIYLAAAAATRAYVKDTLRPKMIELLNSDEFVLEAMSTSFISREVMNRLRARFPGFQYKRAASNPRNPINRANDFEREMIDWFDENRQEEEWTGIIEVDGKDAYAKLMPIQVEQPCLVCHGTPKDAPRELRERYGSQASYGYRLGQVVAADTIYIPMDQSILKIKEKAWRLFIVGLVALFSLSGLFYLLFNRTVVSQLRGLLINFVAIFGEDQRHFLGIPEGSADEIGHLKGAFGNVARDLKGAHDELRISERKYRRLFTASPEAIFICDENARPVDINEAGMALFGFRDREEVYTMESLHQLFWDGRDAFAVIDRISKEGFVRERDVSMVDRQGNRMEVVLTASRVLDEAGRFAGLEAVIRDVTEKRRVDKYLAQTEKMASLGQMAAGVAHEINNPLGVITCYANLIRKGAGEDTQVAADIEIIRKHTLGCKKVVDSLLNFARASKPDKSATDMHACMGELLTVLGPQMARKGITIVKELGEKIPEIVCDEHKMKQVFMNLALNAAHAMPEGGELTVATRILEGEAMVAIQITDTGRGIPESTLKKIFDPFFTTKKAGEGTGLGLAVSYGIVKQHGGEIRVESTPGRGTTFTVLLPVDGNDETIETPREQGGA